jgi:hypothetical protein
MERLFLEFSSGMALQWRVWHSPLQSANFFQLDTPPRSSRASWNKFDNGLAGGRLSAFARVVEPLDMS